MCVYFQRHVLNKASRSPLIVPPDGTRAAADETSESVELLNSVITKSRSAQQIDTSPTGQFMLSSSVALIMSAESFPESADLFG